MVIAGLALGSVNQGCSPAAGYQRPEEQGSEQLSSLLSGSFEACWNKRTMVLGSQSSRGVGLPFLPGGPGERGEGPFPLIVRATIMDSMLVEAGIREFGCLAGMDTNSLNAYRRSYRKHHHLDENAFVYVEIQTFLAEEYLEADRWIFFVEDQQRNQIEPVRVVQHPVQQQTPRPGSPYELDSPAALSPVKRIIELYFPLKRFPQVTRPLERFGTLRFVVLDINNSYVRAEGMWDLTALQ
jgi:hypothetical protein